MECIAIIPARGGSKRIPRKNIKNFSGKPIIAYSIDCALRSGLFTEIMVSTDTEPIASIARTYGANIPFYRSEENSNDYATLNDVINEVLERYTHMGRQFDYGCCILPTAPLITTERLQEAFLKLTNGGFDSVRPIVRFSYPIQRAVRLSADNKVQMFYPEHAQSRSQDLEPAYYDAGQFYWFKTDKMLTGSNKGGIVIDEIEAQDIDTIDDWKMAELKMEILHKMNRISG